MDIKRISLFIIFLFVLLTIFASCSFACSTFMFKHDNSFIVGHNLDDVSDYVPGYVFVNKRGISKTNFTRNDVFGKANTTPRITWTSKYGSVTFNSMGREFPDGGINQAGLFVEEMTLMQTVYPVDNSRPHMIAAQWIQYQLDNYQSVEELLKNVSQFVPDWSDLWLWHFFISDKQGNYACIEFIKGKPIIHLNRTMPIPVLCNEQYSQDMKLIKNYNGFGGTGSIFPKVIKTDIRFFQAAYMIKNYQPNKSKSIVDYGFDILKQIRGNPNHWSIIIDTENSLVYFQTSHCRNIKFFSFKNFDFSSTTPVMMFDLNSNLSGDVSKLFLPYSFQRNKQLVTEAAKYVDSLGLRIKLLFSFSTQGNMIDRLARCPDSTIKIRKRKYKKLVW